MTYHLRWIKSHFWQHSYSVCPAATDVLISSDYSRTKNPLPILHWDRPLALPREDSTVAWDYSEVRRFSLIIYLKTNKTFFRPNICTIFFLNSKINFEFEKCVVSYLPLLAFGAQFTRWLWTTHNTMKKIFQNSINIFLWSCSSRCFLTHNFNYIEVIMCLLTWIDWLSEAKLYWIDEYL